MAFKLKSGNKPLFKKLGASPLKDVDNTISFPGRKDEVVAKIELDEVKVEDIRPKKEVKKKEVVVEDKKPEKKIEKKPEKKTKKPEKKKDEKKDKLTAALEKQNQLNRRKERREKREKYRKKTKSIINLLDKPGL